MSSQGHRCQSWGVGGRAPRFWDGNRGGVVGSPRNIIIAYNLQELGTILCKHLKACDTPVAVDDLLGFSCAVDPVRLPTHASMSDSVEVHSVFRTTKEPAGNY